MTPDRVWLNDLKPDHRRIVRNALEPLGWCLEDWPASGAATDTPEDSIEIQIREGVSGKAGALDAPVPTLWILPNGSAIPPHSGEGPHDFVRFPAHRDEIAARARSLARISALEIELRRDQQELARQIDRRHGQVDRMAGDVASRLNAVMGYLDLLLDGTTQQIPGPQRRLLLEAKGATQRVIERMDEIVDASRAEAEFPVAVRLDRLELKPMLEGLLEWSIPRMRSGRQELAVHLEPDTPPVCGDSERLTQALRHMVESARRAAPDGARIQIGAGRDPEIPGFACVTIADGGPGNGALPRSRSVGMCPDRATLDPRSPASDASLSIAQAIVVALGGDLHVVGGGGCGTRIGICLPLWNSRAARIAEAQAMLSSPTTLPGSAWLCRATAPEQIASLGSEPSIVALSAGELLAVCDEPPAGLPRLGRVREFREAGSLARALLPQLRITVRSHPARTAGRGEGMEIGTAGMAA